THYNIISNVLSLAEIMPADNFWRTISFLPLCHIFERTAVYFYIYLSRSINYPQNLDTLPQNILEVKPRYFITVPRLLEKIYEKIITKGHELSLPKKAIFGWAVNLADNFDPKGYNNWFYNFKLYFARKLVFKKWKEALGGEIKAIISGSATLQPKLARIFTAAGIQIIQGYGLTETSPVLTSNRFEKGEYNLGTVGPAIPEVELKIGENKEILAKGPNVTNGYYNKPEETEKAIDSEGWFHTGDTGEFVEDKFLKITGRLKEIFKTSGGKFVAPNPIENKMKESFFIEHIMVIGENEKFVAAIILPEFEFLKRWCKGKKLKFNSKKEMITSEIVRERIMKEINKYNKIFGHIQQVKKIILVNDPWSVETGELTPTLKVKRNVIKERYKNEIEKIYRNNLSDINNK
ncbi:MAG: long-chain fatty acid--CoA ligase, partial [Ignavibacteriales bacterium CG12_big_fil_rev_8_21_14_0_65_30_8]